MQDLDRQEQEELGIPLEADYSSMAQPSPEEADRELATLEAVLQVQRDRVDKARDLVDSPGWEYIYEEINEAVVEFDKRLSKEDEPKEIYRLQGASNALRSIVNGTLATAEGIVDVKTRLTLKDLEERYEYAMGRS